MSTNKEIIMLTNNHCNTVHKDLEAQTTVSVNDVPDAAWFGKNDTENKTISVINVSDMAWFCNSDSENKTISVNHVPDEAWFGKIDCHQSFNPM